MIIVNLLGGLGNQMFQYAAGRALSLRLGQPFLVDAEGFKDYTLHRFELTEVFHCPEARLASEEEIRRLLAWRYPKQIRNILKRPILEILRGAGYIVEPYFHYWPEINRVSGECYLEGYWQSEKYFKDAENVIREDFRFTKQLTGVNLKLSQQMKDCHSISLHVRRGDYVANAQTNSVHGVCSLDYYRDAVAYMAEHVSSPHFFVFSDDIAWVKEHLKIGFPCEYIGHNSGKDSYRDMQLMSLCDHNIIANSSFSWWAAWLNDGEEKIVIAPRQWFAVNKRTDDLIPSDWLRL